jgi:hypothetical protein
MTESVGVWSTQPSGTLWRNAGGWVLLILGVAGLLLPVLPGTPLLIAGLVMLSADHRWARNCLRRARLWIRKHRSDPPKPQMPIRSCPDQNESLVCPWERQPQPPTISTKGEIPMKSPQSETQMYEPAHNQEIRVRAYELFEKRGREPGHDLDDWLQAEAEIVRPARSQIRGVAA